MTLDWQILVIAFIAISLQLLAGGPDLRSVEVDGQLPDRDSLGTTPIKIAAARDR